MSYGHLQRCLMDRNRFQITARRFIA